MVSINIPITLTASTPSVVLFGSTLSDLSGYDYSLTAAGLVSAAAMSGSYTYADAESASPVFADGNLAALASALDSGMAGIAVAAGDPLGNASSFAEMYIRWVANTLFGHPEAQAPIENDAAIVSTINGSGFGGQFTSALTGAVRKVIFEQMFNQAKSRFSGASDQAALPMPFEAGDSISFLVTVEGVTPTTDIAELGETSALPAGLPTLETKTWKITTTLA